MTNADMAALARRVLDTHHAYLHAHLAPLEADLTRARVAPELLRPVAMLRALLDEHLMKEEHILFPRFLALAELPEGEACGVEGPIRQMHLEHGRIRELEHEIRGALDRAGPHRDAIVALLDDLAVHARVEDEELFAEALAREGVPAEDRLPRPEPARRPSPRPAASPPRPTSPEPRRGLRERLKGLLRRG